MFDPRKLLDQFLGAQVPGVDGTVKDRAAEVINLARDNPMATSAITGLLFSTKAGRKLTGNVAALGGLAAIAGLGYQAYRNYQAGQSPEAAPSSPPQFLPPPSDSGFASAPAVAGDDFALSLVRAMIAAARADGTVDAEERERIFGKFREAGINGEAGAFLEKELAAPVDLDSILATARTEEQRVQIYTASHLAVHPETRAERGYLDMVAGRLGLADALVAHIEATVATAKA
jgi:uncharacterized membrane protein YebE (DUF533 family)